MSVLIGTLDVQDKANGYWFTIEDGHPSVAVAESRGERVLIPGRDGLYTPANNFEPEHLTIRLHGMVQGDGTTHADIVTSFASRMAALRTACDTATRSDVTITAEDGSTIAAGWLRFTGPPPSFLGYEAWEFDIEFDATDPPEWT